MKYNQINIKAAATSIVEMLETKMVDNDILSNELKSYIYHSLRRDMEDFEPSYHIYESFLSKTNSKWICSKGE